MALCEFTKAREELIIGLIEQLKPICSAVILTGSMAYAPNEHVKEDSDVDLILLTDDLKRTGKVFIPLKKQSRSLDNRFFDGYCIKTNLENIPVSCHILSLDAFDIISKCFVADIRVFRQVEKKGNYILKNFSGRTYSYKISNKTLSDFAGNGFRTIVPVSFIKYDSYFNGVYRDKLLCSPRILYDPKNIVTNGLEKLWKTVVMNLKDESLRINGRVTLSKMNILNSLAKGDKLNNQRRKLITEKTKKIIQYLSN